MAEEKLIQEVLLYLSADESNIERGIELLKKLQAEINAYEESMTRLNEGSREFIEIQKQLEFLRTIESMLKASAQGSETFKDAIAKLIINMSELSDVTRKYVDEVSRLTRLEAITTSREEDMRRRAGVLGADPAWRRVGFGLSRITTFMGGIGFAPEIRQAVSRTSELIRAVYGFGQVAAESRTIVDQFKEKISQWATRFNMTSTQFVAASAAITAGVGAVILIMSQLQQAYENMKQAERSRLQAIREATEQISTLTASGARDAMLQAQQEMEALGAAMQEMVGATVDKIAEALRRAGGDPSVLEQVETFEELGTVLGRTLSYNAANFLGINLLVDALGTELEEAKKKYEQASIRAAGFREALNGSAIAINTQVAAIQEESAGMLELTGQMNKLTVEGIDETIASIENELRIREQELDALQKLGSESAVVQKALIETGEAILKLNERLAIYRDYIREIVAQREAEEDHARAVAEERMKMLDRARDEYNLQRSIRKLQEKAAEDEQKAIKESGEAIKKIWADFREFEEQTRLALAEEDKRFQEEKARLDQQYMESALQDWEKFYREQRQRFEEYALDRRHKEEDFLADMYEAAADNDVVRFKEIERQAERELRQMQEQFELEEKHKLEDFLARRNEDKKQAAIRLADLQKEHEDRRAELLRALEEERAVMAQKVQAERNALQERLIEIRLGLKKQIAEMRNNYEEELLMQAWYNKKRADLEAGLQRQIEQIHLNYASHMVTQLSRIYKTSAPTTTFPRTTATTLSPTSFFGRSVAALTPNVNYTINATANVTGGVTRAEATALLTQASREILSTVTSAYSTLSSGYGGGSLKMTKE